MMMLDKQRIEYFESLGASFPKRVTCSDASLYWNIQIDAMEHGFNASLDDFNDDDIILIEYTINKGMYFGTVSAKVKDIKQAIFEGLIAFRTVH